MNALIQPLLELESYQQLQQYIKEEKTPVLTTGVLDSQKNHLIYSLMKHTGKTAVIITYNELKAKEIKDDLQFLTKDNIMIYPSKDIIFYSADVHSIDIVRQRIQVLEALMQNQHPIIILTVEALLDRLVPREIFQEFVISGEVGNIWNLEEIAKKLIFMGYERVELVEGKGQFALRGGIVDIYPMVGDEAYRIELWDDEIDSIRVMEIGTQRSVEKVENIKIFPARELVFDEDKIDMVIKKIKKEAEKVIGQLEKREQVEERDRIQYAVQGIIERLQEQKTFRGIESYIQYFYEETVTLSDYIPKDTLIFFDEPIRMEQKSKSTLEEFHESFRNRLEKGYLLPTQTKMIFQYEEVLRSFQGFPQILMSTLSQHIKNIHVNSSIHFTVKSMNPFHQKLDILEKDLHTWIQNKYRVLLLAGSKTKGERLAKELDERGITASYRSELDREIGRGQIVITHGSFHKGFEYPLIHFAVISEAEVFGEQKKKRRFKKKHKGATISSFTDLNIGDYVVHENHGVGIYRGIEKMLVDGVSKDYLKISYEDGGNLYVPPNQLDMVQKYIGSEGKKPKLHKLGGAEWTKAKAKAKKAAADLAKDLVALYARRQSVKGFVYSKDTVWQREFEEMFPFEETEDQLSAIEDTKEDMESPKVMDRLICGDVGYGKTEVAIRAAFKAVQDGKQVAYLVPTTILAQQHYNTFVQRMKDFPISIDILSRFRTPKEQKQTIENVKKGRVDILIGTHRILSKDVQYKDLGMLIVDEEQRFGVAHKERIKQLKENIDVLTLTATPIPRTLHMSLVGIRDMSILEEPPGERQPIQTYVMEYNPEFIKDAIHRELSRGGQVYYLYNRVRSIEKVTAQLQKLVPEANIGYAHGQMSERQLEDIMMDFIEGELDVLVCTTIIETGLDISNVNTIIIQDADRMGLSQLYQLRGRVGRSNRIAYAYLMYQKDKVLQESAEKRLQAIKQFTEFGSGFKIAMRDLEIRGAGNLLGAQQHGHMEAVGYDMYCKLLDEAVHELKDEPMEEKFETSIDIDADAYIPGYYIQSEQQKLEIYKKIASIEDEKDFYEIQEELEDRYGDLPTSVQNLLEISLSKSFAREIGILSVNQKNTKLLLTFKENAKIDPMKIPELIGKHKNKLHFTVAKNPYFTYILDTTKKNQVIRQIKNILQEIKGLKLPLK